MANIQYRKPESSLMMNKAGEGNNLNNRLDCTTNTKINATHPQEIQAHFQSLRNKGTNGQKNNIVQLKPASYTLLFPIPSVRMILPAI